MCKPLIPEMPPMSQSTKAQRAVDLLMPGFMQASAGHDCRLMVSEAGEINAVCHDLKFVMTIAFVGWYDPERREFKEESAISANFATYRERLARPKFGLQNLIPVEQRQHNEDIALRNFGLQYLVSDEQWDKIFGLPEVKSEELPSHSHHIGNYVWNGPALGITNLGDGVALMSVTHPPSAMFPEKKETQAERIARVTREMCGG